MLDVTRRPALLAVEVTAGAAGRPAVEVEPPVPDIGKFEQ